ncbi:25148_t:CDS:2 [Gigaspora rosea]|nr:25148_t:CDS:2 [Gigaspora rosea]
MPSSESAAISVVIEEVEIGEFIDYVKEEASSFEKGRNFEILYEGTIEESINDDGAVDNDGADVSCLNVPL